MVTVADDIVRVAREEATNLLKYPDVESAPTGEDLLVITRPPGATDYVVEVRTSHANRGPRVKAYFESGVLPCLRNNTDVAGVYPISFEDACERPGVMCFSRRETDRSVLIPDFYQMAAYDGTVSNFVDSYSHAQKLDRIVFAGASTGSLDPATNERVGACMWSRNHREVTEFYLTNIVQMEPQGLLDYAGGESALQELLCHRLTREEQLKCKYVMTIDGNASSWDRPPWVMRSNSVLMKLRSGQGFKGWYYNLMEADRHFVDVPSLDDICPIFHDRLSHPERDLQLAAEANEFVARNLINPVAHIGYTAHLLASAQKR